jgi:hypothetical protein
MKNIFENLTILFSSIYLGGEACKKVNRMILGRKEGFLCEN